MKLIILAFILSITLHILFFSPFDKIKEETKAPASTSKKVDKTSKANVRYVKLVQKVQEVQKPVKKPEAKKIEKPKQEKLKTYKKVEKVTPQKKVQKVTKPKKIIPKPIEKVEIRPTPTKQVPVKAQRKRETIPKKSLENFLLAQPEPVDIQMLDDITKSYLKLYGEEYNNFTKVQKVFLQNNLRNIGRITEKYLRYPKIAVRTRQQGMNIVEFFLHPSGDISDLKLFNSSGYSVLDKNSLETIEIAYKDYPRPKTKTKIRIYVYYNLY